MKPIELNIFWLSGEQMRMMDLGIDNEDDVIETKLITFYHIDHIAEYDAKVNFKTATRIISGGCDYLVAMDYESLKSLINEHI